MKLSVALVLLATSVPAGAFAPSASVSSRQRTSLMMSNGVVDRRSFASTAGLAIAGVVATTNPTPAHAMGYGSDYAPKFDDLKQIYVLGVTLDKLAEKVADPDKFGSALEGLTLFNKDPNFYVGYGRNYVSKLVKNNADGDDRVGYVRQASAKISSCQDLLEGRQGLEGKAAANEAVKRVKEAQRLIGKFLAESGVEDEKVAAYVKAHS